jgi:hypothetical protein
VVKGTVATKTYFCLKNSGVASVEPHEAEFVDALHKISTEKDLRTIVKGLMLNWHPSISIGKSALYVDEIKAVVDFVGGNEDEAAAA